MGRRLRRGGGWAQAPGSSPCPSPGRHVDSIPIMLLPLSQATVYHLPSPGGWEARTNTPVFMEFLLGTLSLRKTEVPNLTHDKRNPRVHQVSGVSRKEEVRVWGPGPCHLALGLPREALDRGVTGFAGWSRAHAPAVRGSSSQRCTNRPPGARRETDPTGPRTATRRTPPDHASHLPFLLPPRGPHTGTSKSILLSLTFTKENQSVFCRVWLRSWCF